MANELPSIEDLNKSLPSIEDLNKGLPSLSDLNEGQKKNSQTVASETLRPGVTSLSSPSEKGYSPMAEQAKSQLGSDSSTSESEAGKSELQSTDWANKYNTRLNGKDLSEYSALVKKYPRLEQDKKDYDTAGWFLKNKDKAESILSNKTKNPDLHYGTDEFKKPNHPTFSDESIYHGKDGYEGGHWEEENGKDVFKVGRTNMQMRDKNKLNDYFKQAEPNTIIKYPEAKVPGESPEYTAYKAASKTNDTVDQLKNRVKEDILSEDGVLKTPQAIDSYADKLKAKYSPADISEIKRYAEKIASTSDEYKKLKDYVNGPAPTKEIPTFSMDKATSATEVPPATPENKGATDRDAHARLGQLALEQNDPQAAVNYFSKAMTLPANKDRQQPTQDNPNPQNVASNDTDILYGIGFAKQQLGNTVEAKDYYNDAIKADPNGNSSAKRGLASIEWKEGDKDKAQNLLLQAKQEDAPFRGMLKNQTESKQEFETRTAQDRYEKLHENDTRDYLNNIADGLTGMITNMTPIGAVNAGFDEGVESLKAAGNHFGTRGQEGLGALRMYQGVTQIGMGLVAATPEGALFNMAAGGSQEVLPEKLGAALMQPVTSALQFINSDPSEAQKSTASFLDMAAQALIMHGLHTGMKGLGELADKFKNNEPLTPDDVDKFKKAADDMPQSTIKEAVEKANEAPKQPQDEQLTSLTKRKADLEEAHGKSESEYAKNIYAAEIHDVNEQISKRQEEIASDHHEEAATHADTKEKERSLFDLNAALEEAPNETAKGTIQGRIDKLKATIKETEPSSEELPKGEGLEEPYKVTGTPIIEHGQDWATKDNVENGINPTDLTEKGKAEAREQGRYLEQHPEITQVIHSPVQRAVQTVDEALAEARKGGRTIENNADEDFATADIGKNYENKPQGTFPEEKWIQALTRPGSEQIAPGAEFAGDFKDRMVRAAKKIVGLDDAAMVVAHSKVMASIKALKETNPDFEKDNIEWTDETTKEYLRLRDAEKFKQEPVEQEQLGEHLKLVDALDKHVGDKIIARTADNKFTKGTIASISRDANGTPRTFKLKGDKAEYRFSDARLEPKELPVQVGFTPYAAERNQHYYKLNEDLQAARKSGDRAAADKIVKLMSDDVRAEIKKIIPEEMFTIKPSEGYWIGSTESSYVLGFKKLTPDVIAALCKAGEHFDQDEVHIRSMDGVDKKLPLLEMQADGSFNTLAHIFEFKSKEELAKLLPVLTKDYGFSGATILENNKLLLYLSDNKHDPWNEGRENVDLADDFSDKVNKLAHEQRGSISQTQGAIIKLSRYSRDGSEGSSTSYGSTFSNPDLRLRTEENLEQFKGTSAKEVADALPIQESAKMDVQSEAGNGEGVGKGNPKHQEPSAEGGEEGKEQPEKKLPEEEVASDQGGGKTTGISHKAQTKTIGQEPPRGEGVSNEDAIKHGEQLLAKGADIDEIAKDFKESGKISYDALSAARANDRQFVKAWIEAKDEFGENSPEAKAALAKKIAFYNETVKPMLTEWHKIGMASQGETEIDTGSYAGIRMSFAEKNGKDMTADQKKTAQEHVDMIKKLKDINDKLQQQLDKAVEEERKDRTSPKSIKEKSSRIAAIIRKGKLNKPGYLKSGIGTVVWDGALEVAAKTIEATGTVAEAISNALKHLKDSEWYKSQKIDLQNQVERDLHDYIKDNTPLTPEEKSLNRLEKELSDLQEGKVKETKEKREPTQAEKELKEQIRQAKEDLGLIPAKELPKTPLSPEEKTGQLFEKLSTKFVDKKDSEFGMSDVKDIWNYAKGAYLDKGRSYPDMLAGVSKDLGLTSEQVQRAISQPKGAKAITDEMWRNQDRRIKADKAAKEWVETANTPKFIKFLKVLPSAFFQAKTFGHGTVGFITHAGMNIFKPSEWAQYWPHFMNQYKNAFGSNADYQMRMNDLVNDAQYPMWKRAGLSIDPFKVTDDYQTFKRLFGRLSDIGDRGFNALKPYRLDLAKKLYSGLSEVEKADPNSVKEIADIVNHSTGVSKVVMPSSLGTVFFAPRLEAARWSKLIVQPIEAVKTFTNWKNSSPSQRAAAKIVAKRAGETLGTMAALLAANQGILSATGSDHKINVTDPTKPDFMKFKVGGHTLDATGGMISTTTFIGKLLHTAIQSQESLGKDSRFDKELSNIGSYARGKLSPIMSTIVDFAVHSTFNKDVLPPYSDKPMAGKEHLTWGKYLLEQQAPIPVAEAVKSIAESMKEKGMTQPQVTDILKGIGQAVVAGGIGAKIGNEPQKSQAEKVKEQVAADKLKTPHQRYLDQQQRSKQRKAFVNK